MSGRREKYKAKKDRGLEDDTEQEKRVKENEFRKILQDRKAGLEYLHRHLDADQHVHLVQALKKLDRQGKGLPDRWIL